MRKLRKKVCTNLDLVQQESCSIFNPFWGKGDMNILQPPKTFVKSKIDLNRN